MTRLGILFLTLSSWAFADIVSLAVDVTPTPPPVKKVAGQLLADEVLEVDFVGLAYIKRPQFSFTEDFGYGEDIYPLLRYEGPDRYSYITDYICKAYNYGPVVGVRGVRTVSAKYFMEHLGSPREKNATGLVINEKDLQSIPETVICKIPQRR